MLARLDYENLIQVNQAEVSEQVGMNRHNVKLFNQEADRAWRYPRGRQKSALAALTGLTLTSGGKAQPKAIGRLCTST